MQITLHYNPWVIALLVIWVLPWKIYSIWLAVRKGDKKWFIALLIVNTFGILEIIYIFYVAKKSWTDVKALFTRLFKHTNKKNFTVDCIDTEK